MARDRLAAMRVSPSSRLTNWAPYLMYNMFCRLNSKAGISEDSFITDALALILGYAVSDAPSYPPSNDGGYQSRRPNPYAQQDDRYEMTDVNQGSNIPLTSSVAGDDMSAFYSEVVQASRCLSKRSDMSIFVL